MNWHTIIRTKAADVRYRIGAAVIVGLLLLGASFWAGRMTALRNDPARAAAQERDELIAQVSSMVDFSSDEAPTILTVNDTTVLKSDPFFAEAQKGDKILVYAKAKKVVLFDPRAGRILKIEPLPE